MLSSVLSFVGWSYLPHLATSKLLPVLHRFYPSLTGRPAPPPNTPLYARHYRYVYAITVISYLFYNFRQAALSMPPNYYEMLGVDPTADENALKSAFKQFARRYHPDRVGPQGEALFINVRDAFEALKNPTTRFAYDRSVAVVSTTSACNDLASGSGRRLCNGQIAQHYANTFDKASCNLPAFTLSLLVPYCFFRRSVNRVMLLSYVS